MLGQPGRQPAVVRVGLCLLLLLVGWGLFESQRRSPAERSSPALGTAAVAACAIAAFVAVTLILISAGSTLISTTRIPGALLCHLPGPDPITPDHSGAIGCNSSAASLDRTDNAPVQE